MLPAVVALVLSPSVRAGTIPQPVFDAVHGRVSGWAASTGGYSVAVYVDRRGGDWCGLPGASWRIALVETRRLRVVADRRIGSAMCGNSLSWVSAGRFSDGRHPEVAFMLWSTPSIGAFTYLYRLSGSRLSLLAKFGGDRENRHRDSDRRVRKQRPESTRRDRGCLPLRPRPLHARQQPLTSLRATNVPRAGRRARDAALRAHGREAARPSLLAEARKRQGDRGRGPVVPGDEVDRLHFGATEAIREVLRMRKLRGDLELG